MLTLVPEPIEAYAQKHSSALPPIFEELRQYTLEHTDLPQMQVGTLEGNLLRMFAKMLNAKRVLEIGTFTGYSALAMAHGMQSDGELFTCELSDKHADIAQMFFDKCEQGQKITIKRGPALESIKSLEGPFDLCFIDADKVGYRSYFDLIYPMMRSGGLMVLDNVLWSGKVLQERNDMEESTAALADISAYLSSREELDKVMLTVRDGMTLILKP